MLRRFAFLALISAVFVTRPVFAQQNQDTDPEDADAGWGLFLVEQLADAWGVGDGGKGVWFEIERASAEAATAG